MTIPVDAAGAEAVNDNDAIPDEAPKIGIPVLPPPRVDAKNPTLEKLLGALSLQQRKLVDIAQKRADDAALRRGVAEADLKDLNAKFDATNNEIANIRRGLDDTRAKLKQRALAVFVGGEFSELGAVLSAQDANDFVRTVDLVANAQSKDTALIDLYRSQVAAFDAKNADLNAIVAQKQEELATIASEQEVLAESLQKVQEQLASITSGAAIALGGFVFPVGIPNTFGDSFGFPRMFGTKYAHSHEGTDIMAAEGTPLYAVSRGVMARVGQAVLGGNKMWLVGADGTQYYYAHLSAYAEGIADGTFVEAGQIIGFVGSTGNAKGGLAHLHFEIHPGGGPAVNPFPFLQAVKASDAGALLRAAQAASVSVTSLAPQEPGVIRAGIGVVREVALTDVVASAAGPTTTAVPGATKPVLPYRKVDPVLTIPSSKP